MDRLAVRGTAKTRVVMRQMVDVAALHRHLKALATAIPESRQEVAGAAPTAEINGVAAADQEPTSRKRIQRGRWLPARPYLSTLVMVEWARLAALTLPVPVAAAHRAGSNFLGPKGQCSFSGGKTTYRDQPPYFHCSYGCPTMTSTIRRLADFKLALAAGSSFAGGAN